MTVTACLYETFAEEKRSRSTLSCVDTHYFQLIVVMLNQLVTGACGQTASDVSLETRYASQSRRPETMSTYTIYMHIRNIIELIDMACSRLLHVVHATVQLRAAAAAAAAAACVCVCVRDHRRSRRTRNVDGSRCVLPAAINSRRASRRRRRGSCR